MVAASVASAASTDEAVRRPDEGGCFAGKKNSAVQVVWCPSTGTESDLGHWQDRGKGCEIFSWILIMVLLSVLAGPAVVADPAGWVSHAGHAKLAGKFTGPLSLYFVPR